MPGGGDRDYNGVFEQDVRPPQECSPTHQPHFPFYPLDVMFVGTVHGAHRRNAMPEVKDGQLDFCPEEETNITHTVKHEGWECTSPMCTFLPPLPPPT